MRRRTSADCSKTSKPQTRTVPEVAGRKPVMIRIVVVLPAPFGPRKPSISPGGRREGDVLDRRQIAVPFAQVRDFDHVSLWTKIPGLEFGGAS